MCMDSPLPIHASVNFLLPVKVLARHVTSKMTPVHEANATASEKHICLIVCLFCICSSIHIKKEKHNFTREAQFKKDRPKTNV